MKQGLMCSFLLALCGFSGSPVSAQQHNVPLLSTVFDVRNFGAVGSGIHLETEAFQRAIDSCSAAGGGTVVVSPGRFRIGTVVLKSNITLYLVAGATLLGSDRLEDYRPHKSKALKESHIPGAPGNQDFGSLHLLYAEAASKITVTGKGTIDGNGRTFWDEIYQPKDRPHQMIQFEGCEDIRIDGITLVNSPFWAINIVSSSRVHINGITILNDRRGPNTDGIDISSSSNVFISNCFINTGDDAICLKGPYVDQSTENIVVTNCTLISDDSAVKLGTRSNGDIRNVLVSHCIIRDSNYGIALFMKDGGTYEDLLFTDMIIETADPVTRRRAVFPLFVDVEKRHSTSKAGTIRNVTFQRINITSDGHSLVAGMPEHFVQGITLQDIRIRVQRPANLAAISKPRGVRGLATAENDYSCIPSNITFAFARGVMLKNISLDMGPVQERGERHMVFARETGDLTIDDLRATGANRMLPMIALDQCSQVYIRAVRVPREASAFLALSGSATKDISAVGNDLSAASGLFLLGSEVAKHVLRESQNSFPPQQQR